MQELIVFKKLYGHCNVMQNWVDNPKLGKWVSGQRQAKRQGQLSAEQIKRLQELGFRWTK